MAYNLKSEEDVKEYLKNLGTEYRFGCFSEKKPEVCHLLADYMEAIAKDFQKAGRIYRTNCDDYKYAKSCLKAGQYYLLGKGGLEKSMEQGHNYYDLGCTYGCSDSCYRAGFLTMVNLKSTQPTRSFSKGYDQLIKACDDRVSDACYHLSGLHIDGFGDHAQKDMRKAFEYASKACGMGHIKACVNVSIMYRKGDGVEKDLEKSEKYKKLALDLKDDIDKKKTLVFQEGLNPT